MNQFNKIARFLCISLAAAVLPVALVVAVAAPAFSSDVATVLCNIQHGSCIQRTGDGMTIEFDVHPKPVATMSESTFVVIVTRNGMPITDASVQLDLSMPHMFMGTNRLILNHSKDGRYEGKGVITRCASGKKTWQADVAVGSAGKTSVARYVFEVK